MLSVATCTCECVCVCVSDCDTLLATHCCDSTLNERHTHREWTWRSAALTEAAFQRRWTHTHTQKKGVKPLPFQLAASLGLWLNSFWGFHLSEQAEAQRQQYRDEQEGVGGCGEGLDGQIQRERQGVMSRGRREKTQQFSFPFFFFF